MDTLLYLNTTYPDIVDVFRIGESWQGRTIYCVRLTSESQTQPKPKVLFVGYHHSAEPISAELPLYFVVQAATDYGTNKAVTRMIDLCEIYVVVALNPDGFHLFESADRLGQNDQDALCALPVRWHHTDIPDEVGRGQDDARRREQEGGAHRGRAGTYAGRPSCVSARGPNPLRR